MSAIKWFFLSYKKKVEYALEYAFANKQRLHISGFVFDFEEMKIEKE